MKKRERFAVLVAVLSMGMMFTGCPDGNGNGSPGTYSVTIAQGIQGGSITANPAAAKAGETITLTISPAMGWQFSEGSLNVKQEGGSDVTVSGSGDTRTFAMPSSDVTVNGEFEFSITLKDDTNAYWYYFDKDGFFPQNDAKITAGYLYKFTYSFKSDIDIKNLGYQLAEKITEGEKALSDRMGIKNYGEIKAGTVTSGTVYMRAIDTASGTGSMENRLFFVVPLTDATDEPTLTFTRFSFEVEYTGTNDAYPLNDNPPYGYQTTFPFQKFGLLGVQITKGNKYTVYYSFRSNVDIPGFAMVLADTTPAAGWWKQLSSYMGTSGVKAGQWYTNACTFTATDTSTSMVEGRANVLAISSNDAQFSIGAPYLEFTLLEIKEGDLEFDSEQSVTIPAGSAINAEAFPGENYGPKDYYFIPLNLPVGFDITKWTHLRITLEFQDNSKTPITITATSNAMLKLVPDTVSQGEGSNERYTELQPIYDLMTGEQTVMLNVSETPGGILVMLQPPGAAAGIAYIKVTEIKFLSFLK